VTLLVPMITVVRRATDKTEMVSDIAAPMFERSHTTGNSVLHSNRSSPHQDALCIDQISVSTWLAKV
jgi:hypothetical protein